MGDIFSKGKQAVARIDRVPIADVQKVVDYANSLNGSSGLTVQDWRNMEAAQQEYLLGKIAKRV